MNSEPPKRPAVPAQPVQRKVFDVMRPGRAPANSTSKPIIVSHKPMVQDRSVTVNGVGEAHSLTTHKKIIIGSNAPAATAPAAPAMPAPTPVPAPPRNLHVPAAPAAAVPTPETVVAPAVPAPPAPALHPEAPTPVPPLPVHKPAAAPLPPIEDKPAEPALPEMSFAEEPDAQPIAVASDDIPAQDEDLLASMPAPEVDGHHAPAAEPKQIGPRSFQMRWLIPVVIIIVLAVAIIDILLDADFLSWSVPHTHFL